MTPAELVLDKWGGNAAELAHDIGYNRSAWFQWRNRGGYIPAEAQRIILKVAKEKGIKLTASELVGE